MSEFKLIKDEFSEVYQEQQWTYSVLFPFTLNYQTITKITMTDHPWRKKGREWITKELILDILTQLNNHTAEPSDYEGQRQAFIEEVYHSDRPFLVVFWWEDNHSDWLWIRNCYPLD